MTIWGQINHKMDLFAGDPEPEIATDVRLFPENLRIEGWNWAQRLLCQHTPRQRKVVATVDTGNRSVLLPSDFFAIEGLYDAGNSRWWWPMHRRPGDVRYDDDNVLEFWVWDDKLFLESDVDYETPDLELLYWAYYPDVEYTEDGGDVTVTQKQIYTPHWAELALLHMTVASCMVPHEVFSSDISQYKIRVESGSPMDNPRMQSAQWHLQMYERLIDKCPPAKFSGVQ